jgi:hypothetical protein
MLKTAMAAVCLLAAVSTPCAFAHARVGAAASSERIVLTRAEISRIKASLRLTSEQMAYWQPIESTLREVAVHGAHGIAVASEPIVLDPARLQRLIAAAMALLTKLDERQRREASLLARSMGLGPLVASY